MRKQTSMMNNRTAHGRLTTLMARVAVALLVTVSAYGQPNPPDDTPSGRQPGSRLRSERVDGREVAAGEVIVRFRADGFAAGGAADLTQAIAQLRLTVDAETADIIDGNGLVLLRSRNRNAQALVRELSGRRDVLYAEPNYIVRASGAPNDPRFGDLWGLHNTGGGAFPGLPGADIKALAAWDITTGSPDNVVAVIDTGIDYTHPDLAANLWAAPASFTVTVAGRSITCPAGSRGFNAITNTCNPMDDQGHGTHVAGTIGALGNNGTGVVGVNHTASIMAIKFLNAEGSGTIADAIKAVDFAVQVKAKFAATRGANIRVLNNSWGGDGFSQAMLDAINRASQADMLFVAAAGNDGVDLSLKPTYPASYTAPNMVTVAATNNRDERAYFSNYGRESTHLAAPGESVLSTTPGAAYKSLSGTSMAAPHVAGAAVLVLSHCPVNTTQLKSLLLSTVDRIASMNGITVTGGRLNVAAALASCAAPYFTMTAAPAEQVAAPGGVAHYTVTLTPLRGFSGSVALSAIGLPAGVTASFSPSSLAVAGAPKTATMTLSAGLNALAGVHRVTIKGVSGTQQRSAFAAVRVPGYTVTNLGTLPTAGERTSSANGISNTGQVVGTTSVTPSGWMSSFDHAFTYSGGAMKDLGTLGGFISRAFGTSNAGHIVGFSLTNVGYSHAFLYSGNRMTDLGTLPGHEESYAYGVNDAGQVVGYSANGSLNERAFLRTGTTMKDLGTLGGRTSRAAAISNMGHVVGYAKNSAATDHAFLYTGSTMKDLGTLAREAGATSYATDVNDAGQVVGYSTVRNGFSSDHAFLYTGGTMKDLGTVGGYTFSYARGINKAGHVVGFSSESEVRFTGDNKRAFLHKDNRMLDLNEALQPGTGWMLLEAAAINDSGQIVGTGRINGELRAFLLTPLVK